MSDSAKEEVKAAEQVTETAGETKMEVDASAKATTHDLSVPKIEGKTEAEVEELLAKAAKQVYFYFSDANLPQDKFFFSLTVCNKEGWVPIKTISTFKRMRELQPHGQDFVTLALRRAIEAEGSDPLLAVSEDGQNVRRVRSLEPDTTAWSRSAYIKGFGAGDSEDNSLDKIEAYVKQFGPINAIRMRREDTENKDDEDEESKDAKDKKRVFKSGYKKGAFKGSVFIEFKNAADLTAFLEKKELPKFAEEEMVFMSKEDYVAMKVKEKGLDPKTIRRGNGRKDGDSSNKSRGPNEQTAPFNAFREMAKLRKGDVPRLAKIPDSVAVVGEPLFKPGQRGEKRERDEEPSKPRQTEIEFEYNGGQLKFDRVNNKVLDPENIIFTENAVVKFVNCDPNADWKQLKVDVQAQGIERPFIAYPPGSAFGRMAKYDSSVITDEERQKLNDAKIKFGANELAWEQMSEPEQREFWATRAAYQGGKASEKLDAEEASASDKGRDRGGRGRGGRGGRGGGGRGGGGRGGRGRGGGRGGHREKRSRDDDDGNGREKRQKDNSGLPPTVATD